MTNSDTGSGPTDDLPQQRPLLRCGIVYVASMADSFVEEAFLSAVSVKARFPELHITLFTDRPWHALCATGHFDKVEPIIEPAMSSAVRASGKLNRSLCLQHTPYERTLHIDTDTRVLTTDIDVLYRKLDRADLAMVETAEDDSYSRRHLGRRMFNTGMLLYKKSEKISQLLCEWTRVSQQNFEFAGLHPLPEVPVVAHIKNEDVRRRLLYMDQIAFVDLLSPHTNRFGVVVETLDASWNFRGSRLLENNRCKTEILHSPALRELVYPDLQALAFTWKHEGRSNEAKLLDMYLDLVYRARSVDGV